MVLSFYLFMGKSADNACRAMDCRRLGITPQTNGLLTNGMSIARFGLRNSRGAHESRPQVFTSRDATADRSASAIRRCIRHRNKRRTRAVIAVVSTFYPGLGR